MFKKILLMLLLWSIGFTSLQAQSRRSVSIKSRPSGAIVCLEGEYTIVGRTPCKITGNLTGTYKIKAYKRGYENWSSTINFLGQGKESVIIHLSPKTRFKAMLRSMVFPGWGQVYSGRRTKGAFISLLQLGSAISTAIAVIDYNNKVNDYNDAVSKYEKKKKIFEEREKYWKIVSDRKREADKAYDLMQTLTWITVGIWIYNVLDCLFFFPSYENIPMISGYIQEGNPSITISMEF